MVNSILLSLFQWSCHKINLTCTVLLHLYFNSIMVHAMEKLHASLMVKIHAFLYHGLSHFSLEHSLVVFAICTVNKYLSSLELLLGLSFIYF